MQPCTYMIPNITDAFKYPKALLVTKKHFARNLFPNLTIDPISVISYFTAKYAKLNLNYQVVTSPFVFCYL